MTIEKIMEDGDWMCVRYGVTVHPDQPGTYQIRLLTGKNIACVNYFRIWADSQVYANTVWLQKCDLQDIVMELMFIPDPVPEPEIDEGLFTIVSKWLLNRDSRERSIVEEDAKIMTVEITEYLENKNEEQDYDDQDL